MRNLDAIIIIYSTGEEAEHVKAQADALEYKCKGRATWVHSFGTKGAAMSVNLNPPSNMPQQAKLGIYIVGHASTPMGVNYAGLWDHSMEDAVKLVVGVVKCFKGAVLQKVSLVACNLAAGEVNNPPAAKDMPTAASMKAGSFVQQFCGLLAKENLVPKVAGWTGPIDVMTSDEQVSDKQKTKDNNSNSHGTSYIGRKSVASVGGGQFYTVSNNDHLDPKTNLLQNSYRKDHKFAYQVQNGSVAKLTLDEWHKNP